jgi:hypothetical protein
MSDNQQDMQVPHLKATAIIAVQIGTGFVQRLQELMIFLMEGREEEIKALEIKKPGEDMTPWENSVVTVTMILQDIMKNAKDTDQLEYKSLSSMLPSSPDQH